MCIVLCKKCRNFNLNVLACLVLGVISTLHIGQLLEHINHKSEGLVGALLTSCMSTTYANIGLSYPEWLLITYSLPTALGG